MAPHAGRGRMLAAILGLVVVIAAVGVAAIAFSGSSTGTCVIEWSDMPTNHLGGYTKAECDAKCADLIHPTACYWEP